MKKDSFPDVHYYAGIDPGKDGALVLVITGPEGVVQELRVFLAKNSYCRNGSYDFMAMRRCLEFSGTLRGVVVENQHAMPAQGRTSCVTIGYGWGLWIGIVGTLGVPLRQMSAQQWQKLVCAGYPGKAKERSALACRSLLPKFSDVLKHDGAIDAALMALAAKRELS